jgi:DNA-binding NarL/FixJ family response regulator
MSTGLIKIIIVDDNLQIQKHFQNILQKDPEISIEGVASNGYEAALITANIKPDIILLDINLESNVAKKLCKEIYKHFPEIKIILLFSDNEDKTIFQDYKTFVTDCLHKNSSQNEIISVIKNTFYNVSSSDPFEENKLNRNILNAKIEEDSLLFNIYNASHLTSIELEVLDLMVQEKSQKEICDVKHLEISALKALIYSILEKFDKKQPSDVVEMAQELNLLKIIKPSHLMLTSD